MRKLKLQMSASLNGFVAREDGSQEWLAVKEDPSFKRYYEKELLEGVDLLLMGRKMTPEFTDHWEDIVDNKPESTSFQLAKKLVDIPKIIFSKTITKSEGRNTTVEQGDLVTVVNDLKSRQGGDIIVYGGASFVASLIEGDLIDEYNFLVYPMAIGNGMKIWNGTKKLELIKSRSFACGVVASQYIRA